MQTSIWRLIGPIRASGEIQMAIDRWLLEQHRVGQQPPVLRFYTWDPVAISLGYHQSRWPQRWHHLTWQGKPVDLVRRPTGGRAVLHQGDLTYMVVMSDSGGEKGGAIAKASRLAAYEAICQFLIEGWQSLGVQLHYGRAQRSYAHTSNCFATATGADLVLPTGAKFIGSAQLRSRGVILQHGSMLLEPCTELCSQVFGTEALEGVGGIHELPVSVERDRDRLIETIIAALVPSARRCFNAEMVLQPLSEEEWQQILAFPNSMVMDRSSK